MILSPSSRIHDRSIKLPRYANNNVAHLWLVDPDAKTLEAYELQGEVRRVMVEQALAQAKVDAEAGDEAAARERLEWVLAETDQPGIQQLTRLRLARLQLGEGDVVAAAGHDGSIYLLDARTAERGRREHLDAGDAAVLLVDSAGRRLRIDDDPLVDGEAAHLGGAVPGRCPA